MVHSVHFGFWLVLVLFSSFWFIFSSFWSIWSMFKSWHISWTRFSCFKLSTLKVFWHVCACHLLHVQHLFSLFALRPIKPFLKKFCFYLPSKTCVKSKGFSRVFTPLLLEDKTFFWCLLAAAAVWISVYYTSKNCIDNFDMPKANIGKAFFSSVHTIGFISRTVSSLLSWLKKNDGL